MFTWPPSLHQEPERSSVTISGAPNAMVRTDFDRGAAFQRPLTSGKPKPATMRFRPFSSAQVATFEDFFEQTLGMGSSKFEMPHPFTGLVRVWRFRDVENPYQIEPLGRAHYTVSVNLELFPV